MISFWETCNPALPTTRRDQGFKQVDSELPYTEVMNIGNFLGQRWLWTEPSNPIRPRNPIRTRILLQRRGPTLFDVVQP